MELYLFLALLLIYILTAFMVKKVILHKIWTLAFILAFVVTAVSIAFIRVRCYNCIVVYNTNIAFTLPLLDVNNFFIVTIKNRFISICFVTNNIIF